MIGMVQGYVGFTVKHMNAEIFLHFELSTHFGEVMEQFSATFFLKEV